jgi:hypothetical protein
MSQIFKIKKSDVSENEKYIGHLDVSNIQGDLEIDGDLGVIWFEKDIIVHGKLTSKRGTKIKAWGHIRAENGIDVSGGMNAELSIQSGLDIQSKNALIAGQSISATGFIKVGMFIEAGGDIVSGSYIEAGTFIFSPSNIIASSHIKSGSRIQTPLGKIQAGTFIEAEWNIEAGKIIVAQSVSTGTRIFAGMCFHMIPKPEDMEIRAKLIKGVVAYGTLVEPKSEDNI